MNYQRILFCLVVLVVVIPVQAFADGLFRKLPSEGSWATYRMSEEWSDGTAREIDVTLKALDTETVGGVDCTWVELNFQLPDRETRRAHRFLAPNQFLKTGDDPLGHVLDVWVRNHNGRAHRDISWDGFLPRLLLACPPQIDDEKVLDEMEQFSIDGSTHAGQVVTGTGTQKSGASTTTKEYRLVTSEAVPFGVAKATVSAHQTKNCDPDNPDAICELTTGTIKFTLTAIGDDAQPVVQIEPESIDEQDVGPETLDRSSGDG